MTDLVTLEEVKLFCRIIDDWEDATLATLIKAASEAVLDVADGWEQIEGFPVPARLKLAVLTHVAQAYDNRESGAQLPDGAARLVMPMRRLDI